ncbi:TPA: hypothetical protein RFT64_004081 [Klebsiella aerogenes]|nr:hypothetical protein [Klebsiella aerogenes]
MKHYSYHAFQKKGRQIIEETKKLESSKSYRKSIFGDGVAFIILDIETKCSELELKPEFFTILKNNLYKLNTLVS